MAIAIANHLIYLTVSIAFTIAVGQSLFAHGKPFLMECLGSDKLADAVNRLFLAGFYLLNFAFVLVVLSYGDTGLFLKDSIEILAGRIGLVALVMGLMHCNNLFWCFVVRRYRQTRSAV